MTCKVARWDTSDNTLCFGMQREDIFEYNDDKCQVFTFQYAREKIFSNTPVASVSCVHNRVT